MPSTDNTRVSGSKKKSPRRDGSNHSGSLNGITAAMGNETHSSSFVRLSNLLKMMHITTRSWHRLLWAIESDHIREQADQTLDRRARSDAQPGLRRSRDGFNNGFLVASPTREHPRHSRVRLRNGSPVPAFLILKMPGSVERSGGDYEEVGQHTQLKTLCVLGRAMAFRSSVMIAPHRRDEIIRW